MLDLTIVTDPDSPKGRSFHASLLAYVVAPKLWDGGATSDNIRPIWCMYAATDAEIGPVTANLRGGKKAAVRNQRASRHDKTKQFELLRSAGYEFHTQRHPEGTVVTAYLPDLYKIDPGMVDPAGVKFAVLPAREWCVEPSSAVITHVSKVFRDAVDTAPLMRIAPLFAAYLDRRTRCPLIPDHRFYAQVTVAMSLAGMMEDSGYEEHDVESVGLYTGVGVICSHDALETLLAEQVRLYEEAIA